MIDVACTYYPTFNGTLSAPWFWASQIVQNRPVRFLTVDGLYNNDDPLDTPLVSTALYGVETLRIDLQLLLNLTANTGIAKVSPQLRKLSFVSGVYIDTKVNVRCTPFANSLSLTHVTSPLLGIAASKAR